MTDVRLEYTNGPEDMDIDTKTRDVPSDPWDAAPPAHRPTVLPPLASLSMRNSRMGNLKKSRVGGGVASGTQDEPQTVELIPEEPDTSLSIALAAPILSMSEEEKKMRSEDILRARRLVENNRLSDERRMARIAAAKQTQQIILSQELLDQTNDPTIVANRGNIMSVLTNQMAQCMVEGAEDDMYEEEATHQQARAQLEWIDYNEVLRCVLAHDSDFVFAACKRFPSRYYRRLSDEARQILSEELISGPNMHYQQRAHLARIARGDMVFGMRSIDDERFSPKDLLFDNYGLRCHPLLTRPSSLTHWMMRLSSIETFVPLLKMQREEYVKYKVKLDAYREALRSHAEPWNQPLHPPRPLHALLNPQRHAALVTVVENFDRKISAAASDNSGVSAQDRAWFFDGQSVLQSFLPPPPAYCESSASSSSGSVAAVDTQC